MSSPLKLDQYDVIIAGGGTAGCVLASRLTENPNLTVLLLEAGQDAANDSRITTPGLVNLAWDDPTVDWRFVSEPSPGMGGRRIPYPRGKCLGGSSAINIMAVVYPSKACLDGWADLGNKGWDWDAMAPYYRKFQTHCPPPKETVKPFSLDYLDQDAQGRDGPIRTSYPPALYPLGTSWIEAFEILKKVITGDPLTGTHTGGYTSAVAVDPEKGERSYAGNSFFTPVSGRPNLHVVTGALIDRVELQANHENEAVATGVIFKHEGSLYTAKAKNEIVLCAGTFGSPAILERSGVGDERLSKQLGVKSVIHNSNVGECLQDHAMVCMCYETKDEIQTAEAMRNPEVVQKAMEEYQTSRTGPLALGLGYCFAYTPLTDFIDMPYPLEDLKDLLDRHIPSKSSSVAEKERYSFLRRILEDAKQATSTLSIFACQAHSGKETVEGVFALSEPGGYVTIMPQLAHPFSRGSVHIKSKDSEAHPRIEPNFLSSEIDVEVLARHCVQAEAIISMAPLRGLLKPDGRRIPEGYGTETMERAREFVRANANTNHHPCGTCAMMPQEMGGVVNERLMVHGTKNLRVCDASIFPLQVRGNIMTTVYAVAEKGADILREDLGI